MQETGPNVKFIVLIREDYNVYPVTDVVTKATNSPRLF